MIWGIAAVYIRMASRTMTLISIPDRAWLRERLQRDPALHLYELGDLDPFFFPHTKWFSLEDALCLLYTGGSGSTLIALARPPEIAAARALLEAAREHLP